MVEVSHLIETTQVIGVWTGYETRLFALLYSSASQTRSHGEFLYPNGRPNLSTMSYATTKGISSLPDFGWRRGVLRCHDDFNTPVFLIPKGLVSGRCIVEFQPMCDYE